VRAFGLLVVLLIGCGGGPVAGADCSAEHKQGCGTDVQGCAKGACVGGQILMCGGPGTDGGTPLLWRLVKTCPGGCSPNGTDTCDP